MPQRSCKFKLQPTKHLDECVAAMRPSLLTIARRRLSMSPSSLAASIDLPTYQDWRHDPPSAAGPSSQTYGGQAQLPPLPVPPLESTLKKLRASGRAIARDASEAAIFEGHVDKFEQDELAQTLQKRLQVKAEQSYVGPSLLTCCCSVDLKHRKTKSWLAEDWDRLAYMTYRDSVVCNVSYYYVRRSLDYAIELTSRRASNDYRSDPTVSRRRTQTRLIPPMSPLPSLLGVCGIETSWLPERSSPTSSVATLWIWRATRCVHESLLIRR